MALKGKIYSIAKQYDDLNTNKIFESMMIESTDKNSIVLDGRNIGAGSIFAEQIHANAITADHIKSGAIETDHMDAGTIDVDRLKAGQLILPGINYGGVVIDNSGISMKPTEESRLDVKLSSKGGFNITDGNNQLIDIDPKTGNVIMQVNKMTIGGYSAATAEDIEKRPTFEDFEKTDKVTIDGGNIKAGTISSEKNYSWIDLDDGTFSFGNGGLVWDGLDMVVNGKISVNNIVGDIPKSKLASNVQAEINAGSTAKTKTDAWTHPGTTLIGGDFIQTETLDANRIKANTITANQIAAKSITTEELNVTTLSAITADLGTVTAGTIRSRGDAININLDTGEINLSQPLKINNLDVSTKKEVEDAIKNVESNINNAVTTIDNTGITVKDGSFFLEDDTSDTKYSLQVKRNMIDYHSFETVHAFPPEYNDLTSSTVNPDNTSNTSIGGSWNRVGSPRITRGGATYQNEKVGIFGKSIVANNSNYIFLMLSSSQAELFPGERLTFSFHSKAPILGTGGIPRVEVHMVRANNTVVTTIGTKNYPASTKAIKRHSFSFTIPSNFDDNSHLLRIRVLSSNSNEVVIDGTQLVEGNHPVQYDLATEAWNLREELGMNSQNLRGDINYRGISPGLIHTNQISVPNNIDGRVINFMQSDGISTHMWVDEAVVRRSLDVHGNLNIMSNKLSMSGVPILDSGHNSNGEWMKFYDGTMICRGYKVKTMALNLAWGSMYYGNIGVMTYPQEFSAIPYVVYTNSSESALFYTTSTNRSTSQTGNVGIYRPVSTASQRWEIGYIAIGR